MAESLPKCNDFKWEKLKPMPTKRVFATPADVNGILHVIGAIQSFKILYSEFFYNFYLFLGNSASFSYKIRELFFATISFGL